MFLYGVCSLLRQVGCPLVPEKAHFIGKPGIHQQHAVATCFATQHARTGNQCIAEGEFLPVAAGAADTIIDAQIFVVKLYPAQGGFGI